MTFGNLGIFVVDSFWVGVLGVGIIEAKISYKLEYFESFPNSELLPFGQGYLVIES